MRIACCFFIIAGAVTVAQLAPTSCAATLGSYWSLEGDFESATDSVHVLFELTDPVGSADTFYGATFGHSGTSGNAAGDAIAPGGFDPTLSLFEDLGGAEILHGTNDDAFPAPNRDSLLSWPGVASLGGAIMSDPLGAGNYRMNLAAYEPTYVDGTSPWAMDLRGPDFTIGQVVVTGIVPVGGAAIRSLKFGASNTTAELRLDANDLTIADELVVAASGYANLFVNADATLNTPGSTLVGGPGSNGVLFVSGANALWNAGQIAVGDPSSIGAGNGVVSVSDQGRIASGSVTVAEIPTNGPFSLYGAQIGVHGFTPGLGARARWDIAGSLAVGSTGPENGYVSLTDGGIMTVSQDVNVRGSIGAEGLVAVESSGLLDVAGTLDVGSQATVELRGADSEIFTQSFIVDAQGTFTHQDGTLTVDGGTFDMELGTLSIDGGSGGGVPTLKLTNGAQGSIEVKDGVTPSLRQGVVSVGTNANGRLEILNGSKLTSGAGRVGEGIFTGYSGNGNVLVQGNGSTWEITADMDESGTSWASPLAVGGKSNGTLEILDGAQVFVRNGIASIGRYIDTGATGGATGVALVDGMGSLLQVGNGPLIVGTIGAVPHGELTVSNEGRIVAAQLAVYQTGSLRLTSGGTIFTLDFFVSDGAFTHEDGTLTVRSGAFDPGTPGYTISGAAPGDEPTLELIGGATASFTELVQIGSTGAATLRVAGHVLGNNSRFDSTGDFMDIGWIGSGRLEVLDKGVVDQTGGVVFNLGVAPGASGMVTADGADSHIIAGDLIIVGDHGKGHFAVTGGARVTASRLWIAHYSDAQSSDMLVSGAAAPDAPSLLQISGSAFIGGEEAQGSGVPAALTVNDGGNVVVGDVLRVWPTGAIDLANGSVHVPNGFVSLSGGTLIGDGTIEGDLTNAGVLSPGHSAGVITIDGAYEQDPAGTLEIEIGGTSPTQFDQLQLTGDEVVLAGALDVLLIDPNGGSNVFQPALGDTYDIVTTAIEIAGSFEMEVLPVPSSNLAMRVFYSDFAVTLAVVPALLGDYNANGVVDAADYTVWRNSLGASGVGFAADGDGNQVVDAADYTVWKTHFGMTAPASLVSADTATVPEPAASALLAIAAAVLIFQRNSTRLCRPTHFVHRRPR